MYCHQWPDNSVSPPQLTGPCVCAARPVSARPVCSHSPSCCCASQAPVFGSLTGVWRLAPPLASAPFLKGSHFFFFFTWTCFPHAWVHHCRSCNSAHEAARADRRRELRKRLGDGFTLHGLRLCALDGDFDLALVSQQGPGRLMRGLLLLQLLLQHLQLVGQINLFVTLLLEEKSKKKKIIILKLKKKITLEHNYHDHNMT